MEKGIKHFNKEVQERLDVCIESKHNLDFVDFLNEYMTKNSFTCYYTTFDRLNDYLNGRWFMDYRVSDRTGKTTKYVASYINHKTKDIEEHPYPSIKEGFTYLAKRNFTHYTDNTQKLINAYNSKK